MARIATRGTARAAHSHVFRPWPTPTHLAISALLVGLLVPAAVEAQLGLDLAPPSEAGTQAVEATEAPEAAEAVYVGETLGRDLEPPAGASADVASVDVASAREAAASGGIPSLMPEGWALDLSAITSLPVTVGIEAQLQTPVGVFANLSVGHTPAGYLEMMAGMLEGAEVFGDDISPIIDESVGSGAWNIRVGVGINPIEGLELSVGYTYLGAVTTLSRNAIETATGQRVRYRGMREVPMTIDMHALHGRVGYRFVIEDHFVLRASLGWTHAVAASARLEVPDEVRELPNNPAAQIEEAIDEGFGQYGFTPEVLVSAGYRF